MTLVVDQWPVIDGEAVDCILKTKSGGGYDNDGEWVGEALTATGIRAVVQPATGRVLEDLPEGERVNARFAFWTNANVKEDDLINYDDLVNGALDYRVLRTWPRKQDGGWNKGVMGK